MGSFGLAVLATPRFRYNLAMAGEFDFIQWLRGQQRPSSLVQLGIGDDLAALKWPEKDLLLIGVDQVLDGVHVDSAVHTPQQIGAKAMNRNLSDCAAMGCFPAAAVATVALPRGASLDYAKELYTGMRQAADVFDCPIVGGDTATWPGKLLMTVTILGRSEGITPITRGGAKPGDSIYVSGPLGGSILGRHMNFIPRVHLGRILAPQVSAMIDLSDGLSRDIAHICRASNAGAVIHADRIPIHEDAQLAFRTDRISPLEHALNDGEDYELLCTSPHRLPPPCRWIGQIMDTPGLVCVMQSDGNVEPLAPGGWEHAL